MMLLNWLQSNFSWVLTNAHCDVLDAKTAELMEAIDAHATTDEADQKLYEQELEHMLVVHEKIAQQLKKIKQAQKSKDEVARTIRQHEQEHGVALEKIKQVAIVVFDIERVHQAFLEL